MRKQIREKLITTAVIIFAIIMMVSIFMRFRTRMDRELNASTATYLSGNVDALAAAFQTKLSDQLVMLESQTRYFTDVDLTDYTAMKSTIMATRGMEAFTSIGVASSAGSTMSYQGKSSGNIFLKDYFQRAMEGQSAISEEPTIDEFGNEVLVLAVPIFQAEKVVGVIYGTFTRDALSELLKTVRFGEQSASVLITGDGTILARTTDTNLIDTKSENLQQAIPGLNIETTADGQFFTYQNGDRTNILVLRPVGFHDWYFGMIIPRAIVTEQSDRVLRYTVLVMLEVAFVVVCLLLYIFLTGKRNASEKKKLTEKAQTDLLTGILNKVSFREAVEEALRKAEDQEACALYIIDLDDFKHVNDSLGHAMGDKVISDAAGKLRHIFRDTDVVGRIGGDEFAAFLHAPKERATDELIQTKAKAVCEDLKQLYEANGAQVQVSASIGMARYPEQGIDFDTLFKNADKALYSAKRGGKNRYEAYH